ncbi:hypothetical protein FDENT_12760 [Fusarium denticulatum]|uniref:Uncharacterized protein n=1 Tax=Fusarium denticulatum TaxID=48507 RepID=A0A8H5TA05_9HYPO|nr:hypothetical protein FDENT_12760 [Fusarium denticulatum]
MSTPPTSPFFENEMDNEYWSRELEALGDINLMDNAEQDALLYEAQQTEQAVQDPQDSLDESPEDESPEDESPEDESPEDESAEDERLWGSPSPPSPPPSPLPSPLPSQPGLVFPVPAPPAVTGVTEPQTTAPPAPFDADVAADNTLEGFIPELPMAQPKQPRADAKRVPKQKAPKRIPNRVAKPPKHLSANQQQRQWDQEGMARLTRLRNEEAAKAAAAQLVNGAPGQLYGPVQFCTNCGHNLSQATSVYCPPAGGYRSQAAGPVNQQPPVPTAPFTAYAPAPAPALALAPHLAPPPSWPQIPTTSMYPGIMPVGQGSEAATWQPFATPEQQAMYLDPMRFNML